MPEGSPSYPSLSSSIRPHRWAGSPSTFCSPSHSSKEKLRERGFETRSQHRKREGCGWEVSCHWATIWKEESLLRTLKNLTSFARFSLFTWRSGASPNWQGDWIATRAEVRSG